MSLLEKNSKNFNWPDKKKSLFSERKDWYNLAHLEVVNKAQALAVYSQAYKDAGDRLVECAQTDKTSINFLVFPILFLYRHYLELALKETIIAATQYLEKDHDIKGHNLIQLWEDAKKFIFEADLDIPNSEMDAVANQISQFHKLDQSSETFRYPVDNKGNIFPNLSDYINIQNVREIVDGLHAWFFGLICVLGEYEDAKGQS